MNDKFATVVWREKSSGLDGHETPEYLSCVDISGPANYIRDKYENIFSFLDVVDEFSNSNIVFEDALTKYASESNYRRAISVLFESGNPDAVAVISELVTSQNLPIIFRSLRTLGIEDMVSSRRVGDRCLLFFNRGLRHLDKKLWERDPAPYLERLEDPVAVSRVVQAINDSKPFSMLRVGHCEVRFLGQDYYFGRTDVSNSAQLQWGAVVDTKKELWVRGNLGRSIQNADMLGFNKKDVFSSKPLKIIENSVLNCLSTLSLLRTSQIQVSPNLHFSLGKSKAFLGSLMKAKKIVLVTPRLMLEDAFDAFFKGGMEIVTIGLPGEFRVDGASDLEERFARFKLIEDEVAAVSGRGVVFLIGAGVAGKHYCEIAKNGGGVGLDMGSMLDAWAGIESRGLGFPSDLKNSLTNFSEKAG